MEPPVVLLGVARNGGGTAHAHDEGDRHQDSMDAVAKEAGGRGGVRTDTRRRPHYQSNQYVRRKTCVRLGNLASEDVQGNRAATSNINDAV